MSIDFEIPTDAKAVRERVRHWVREECLPAEKRLLAGEDYKTILAELRVKARAQGLWCPFIPKEYGGMGLGLWPMPWCRWSWAKACWARSP
jgi:acyl-CoA dehydrogenase